MYMIIAMKFFTKTCKKLGTFLKKNFLSRFQDSFGMEENFDDFFRLQRLEIQTKVRHEPQKLIWY